tara:strand:- start:23560 stop:25242 length:1683 start_codon:yes stop_codon:yes gene_type:complete
MKEKKTSFLFFCFVLINIFCAFNFNLTSQTIKDSTLFYYKSLTEITDINATSEAFDFFEEKTKKALLVNDTINAAYYLELISFGQYKMGFLHECETSTIKALSFLDAKNTKTIDARERLFNQLGLLYRKLEDFDNSNKFYAQALELNDDNFLVKMALINNIANNFADQGYYDKAINELYKYYSTVLNINNSNAKATYLDNIGYYQSKINDSNALKNMETALDIRLLLKDLTGLFSSYRHLSLYYSDKSNKEEALKYSRKAKVISDSLNSPIFQQEALKLNLRLENNLNFEEYLELSNSIEKTNQLRENKFAAIKYNVNEKEKIINEKELMLKSSELEKEKEKKFKLIYLFTGASGFLISIFIFFIIKSKHKKDKIQQVYITETRISKKVHDEVANDVYQVMAKLQEDPNIKENILDDLDNIYSRTRDISRENSALDVNDHFEITLHDLLLSYKNDDINIITRNIPKIDWNAIEALKKITLYRVLQELMVNMKKHSQATNVALTFNESNNKINIAYTDNGIGCKIKKGNGFLNMENRIKSIKGTIIFESEINKGFKAKITV